MGVRDSADTTVTATSLTSGMSTSNTGNFCNDFQSFIREFEAPARLLKIVAPVPVGEEEPESLKYNPNGPFLYVTPNKQTPKFYYLRGFKLESQTMRAFLKAIDANSSTKSITINISRCNITPEAFSILLKEGNFQIIKHISIIGFGSTMPGIDFKQLFTTNLDSLKLSFLNLDDQFLEASVGMLQRNEWLSLLSLDFNNFSESGVSGSLEKVLRLNRKLVTVSARSAKGLKRVEKTDLPMIKSPFLEMNGAEMKIFKQVKLGIENKQPTIFKNDKIERKDRKILFPGNTVFKKLIE